MDWLTKYPRKCEDAASRIVEHEAVIVDSGEGLARVLNETATRIWELSDGEKTVAEIAGIISLEFDVSSEQAQDDAVVFFKELEGRKMVVISDE